MASLQRTLASTSGATVTSSLAPVAVFQVGGSWFSFTVENPGSNSAALNAFTVAAKFNPADLAFQTLVSATNWASVAAGGSPLVLASSGTGITALGTNAAAWAILRVEGASLLQFNASTASTVGASINIRGTFSDV